MIEQASAAILIVGALLMAGMIMVVDYITGETRISIDAADD